MPWSYRSPRPAWRRPAARSLTGQVTLDEEAQRATIAFDEVLEPAAGYLLFLRFTGVLNDQLHGFYRSTFGADDGTEAVLAVTQFEPADARRAFPCWDEPEFKASFAVSLVVPEGLTALSNGAIAGEEPVDGGRRRVRFHETMLMSTYLVAFVVGPFQLTPADDVDGVPLRVAAVPGKQHLTAYAREAGAHALRFLARYFELPYPAAKIDHVAIPDFAFGAMENLGCVTYRENALLVNPAEASQLELQRVATVVAHETAHMWFGDLVTMRWWNGIWLNEAFATFMELTVNEDFRPEWQVWTAFGTSKAAALATDGLRNTRPVEFPVGRPDEAEAMFDVLTYQKGAAVLRMLEQYLGPETFRKGINHYLNVHAYANTETGDLWDAIEAVSGEPVRAIMETWILQGGYPLISVEPGDDEGSIRLSQERFLYDGGGAGRQDGGERWAVPVNLRASVGGVVQRQRLLVDGATATINLDGPVDWVVVNDGGWGFYRVQLRPGLAGPTVDRRPAPMCATRWSAWVWWLTPGPAWWPDRTALAEWVQSVRSLSLGQEDDPDVWAAVGGALALLDLIAADGRDRSALQRFVRGIAGPAWDRLGWDPRPSDTATAEHHPRAPGLGPGPARRGPRSTAGGSRAVRALSLGAIRAGPRPAHPGGECGGSLRRCRRLGPHPGAVPSGGHAPGQGALPAGPACHLRPGPAGPDPRPGPQRRGPHPGRPLPGGGRHVQPGRRLPGLAVGGGSLGHNSSSACRPAWSPASSKGSPALVDGDVAGAVHAFARSHDLPLAGPRVDQLLERMDINVALARRLSGSIHAALGPDDSGS